MGEYINWLSEVVNIIKSKLLALVNKYSETLCVIFLKNHTLFVYLFCLIFLMYIHNCCGLV